MNTQTKFQETAGVNPITDQLINFVNQRPGLQFADYGDYKIFRKESREIAKNLQDFRELLAVSRLSMDRETLENLLYMELKNTSGRLGLNESGLYYHVGQYFPTEFRPAACRVLVSILWSYIRDTRPELDGKGIRAYFKKHLSRRVFQNYFK